MSKLHSIKHKVATIATLCFLTEQSQALAPCHDGLDYINGCDEFVKIKNSKETQDIDMVIADEQFVDGVVTDSSSLEVKPKSKPKPIKVTDVTKKTDRDLNINSQKTTKSFKITTEKSQKLTKTDNKKSKIRPNVKFYEVKEGDSLSKIAKEFSISINKLREINGLVQSDTIKVGQKLYLNNSSLKRKERRVKFTKTLKKLRFKRKIRVTATAYTSHVNQTDKTPFLAAWNNRIRPGMKIIAVSPDLIKKYGLTNGVKVKIKGLSGYYVVRDKMNKKWRNKIDIYMGVNKRKALKWGKRKIVLAW